MHPRDQTIFAVSSGRPPSAISIVRVSGPRAGAALTLLAGKIPLPRMATRVLLRDRDRQPIDDAVMLWFPGPASATGEDVAEFHVHGGRAVLAALFAALSALADLRAAEPGEFTRRAFENGKLDLTEAEGLAGQKCRRVFHPSGSCRQNLLRAGNMRICLVRMKPNRRAQHKI